MQINLVRNYFLACAVRKSKDDRPCPFRVHWSETRNESTTDALQFDEEIPDTYTTADEMAAAYVPARPVLAKEFRRAAMQLQLNYNGWVDLYKTLLESRVIGMDNNTYYARRALVDMYTVARIVSQRMKHVMFYGGYFHTRNIVWLLLQLGFKQIAEQKQNTTCRRLGFVPQSSTRPGAVFKTRQAAPPLTEPSDKQFIELCKRHPMRRYLVGAEHQVLMRGPRYWKAADGTFSEEEDGCIVCLLGERHIAAGERALTPRVAAVMTASARKAYKAVLAKTPAYDALTYKAVLTNFDRTAEAYLHAQQRELFAAQTKRAAQEASL